MNTFCSLLQHYLRILNYKAISGKVFREADLNVMTICTEGFGLTALEATSTGLPVIVSIFIIFLTYYKQNLWFQLTPSQRDLLILSS